MAFDKMYYFEKTPSNRESYGLQRYRYYYGEIQNHFNMSFVIDGTKDSCKVQVNNNISEELDPLTICWLESTNTWWIVKSDKVTRYANEIGSYYTHEISLYGAFEILNARDLINCGFNANRYTLLEFFQRLESFMDFEFPIIWNFGNYADEDQIVTYLKTFQNYTPASAIKEMFNGMNLIPKMTFSFGGSGDNIYLTSATITAYSKSGSNAQPIDISTFDNEEEQSTSDIESFGTRVISNVQNCVSADPIRYPAIGGARLVSDEPIVNANNGFLRLPSNIYQVNSMLIGRDVHIFLAKKDSFGVYTTLKDFGPTNALNFSRATLLSFLRESFNFLTNAEWESFIENNYEDFYEAFSGVGVYKLNNGGSYNKIDSTWNEPYLQINAIPTTEHGNKFEITLNDKAHGTTAIYNEKWAMWWEQGKDKIENFKWLLGEATSFPYGDSVDVYFTTQDGEYRFTISDFVTGVDYNHTIFAIEYVPMDDLKIKVDNHKEQNDSNLYNQNGKLVDSVAISKLINSHAVEISSNEITRYKVVRSFSDVPKPSRIVINGNDRYIINNVSVDFYENDDDNYFIAYQVTMTKQTACKSTMISANTNIRDYDCPQQNNVPRIQLYRDYIEFGYQIDNNDTPYLSLSQILNFTSTTKGFTDNHTCVFCVDDTYYYQIGTSKYNLNKQVLEIANFKDNNVIGYEAGKSYEVLQVSTLLNRISSDVNTPISYVDGIGELTSLKLLLVDSVQIEAAYEASNALDLIGHFVTIPTEVWTYFNSNENNYDILINEPNYKKDGLEVPVFEYSCQVGDANGIVFGADFLKGRSGTSIKYYYKVVDNVAPITQENATLYMAQGIEMTTLPSFANNELTLSLTGNSTNVKGKNVVFWCEVFGEESSTYSHIYQTNSYFSNYDDGNQTIMLPAHSPNSTFELVDYIISSSEHTIDAIARIDSYSTSDNTINFTLAEPRSISETISGILSFDAFTTNYKTLNINLSDGTTEQTSIGTENKQQSVTVGSVYCGRFDINSDGWVSDPITVTFSDIPMSNITFGSSNSVNDTITRLNATQVQVIFWRRNRGSTSSSTSVTAYYTQDIGGYKTTIVYGSNISAINYGGSPSISSSGIQGYDNTVEAYVNPNTNKMTFRCIVYTDYIPQDEDYVQVYCYVNEITPFNIEVSGNGSLGEQTFSVASYGQLSTANRYPSIRLIGDPTDPVVNIVSLNQNTGELVYNAYDNDDHSFDVGVVFKYKETTSTGTIRDFLFSVNDCKVDATNTLTLKVNNWKLK